jgi:putative hemolysin
MNSPHILEPKLMSRMPVPVQSAVRKILKLEPLGQLYAAARDLPSRPFVDHMLSDLGVRYQLPDADLARIPAHGPAIIAANHPFGLLEGLVLYSLLPRVRSDFRVMANALLNELPELRSHLIPVDVFGGAGKPVANRKALTEALRCLEAGGLLVVFPAGEVSSWDWHNVGVEDPAWGRSLPWLARLSNAPVIPFYFSGANSALFQLAGLVHPSLRTLRLPAELVNKRGATIAMRCGKAIAARDLAQIGDESKQAEYLRARAQLLCYRAPAAPAPPFAPAIISPINRAWGTEVDALRPDQLLNQSGDYDTYLARSREIPGLVTEIGRLREAAFRQAGEGTGSSVDTDTFDAHYEHLFVWNRVAREVVGAYRLAPSADILRRQGPAGLYTSTLFRYRPEFFRRLGPAIELGRSFVRVEYQREFAPLLLLWRGLTQCALRYSPVLFGAVSISNGYCAVSRQLIVEFLSYQAKGDPLRALVRARRPFRGGFSARLSIQQLAADSGTLDRLSAAISDLEPDGRGVPVLLRQYAKLGARALAFHVDRHFGNTLDCLIVVDLRQSDPASLRQFLPPAVRGLNVFASSQNVSSQFTNAC